MEGGRRRRTGAPGMGRQGIELRTVLGTQHVRRNQHLPPRSPCSGCEFRGRLNNWVLSTGFPEGRSGAVVPAQPRGPVGVCARGGVGLGVEYK